MTTMLRVGTRGSDLALWQTRWFCDRLRAVHPSLEIKEIIIKTEGDALTERPFDENWPVGGFVGVIEQTLARNDIDLAVHSYKDLPTAITPGLVIAAIPGREVVYDVIVTREPFDVNRIPDGFRVGTSSPRRIAQFRRAGKVEIVPIRGNVPTRIQKLETENLDGVVLAGAGLKRLSIEPKFCTPLPVDRFVPAPAQGALAIQTRDNDPARDMVGVLDDPIARMGVDAERAFLRGIDAGCHTPAGALSVVQGRRITLHAQLFSDDFEQCVEVLGQGDDPEAVGLNAAQRLLADLQD